MKYHNAVESICRQNFLSIEYTYKPIWIKLKMILDVPKGTIMFKIDFLVTNTEREFQHKSLKKLNLPNSLCRLFNSYCYTKNLILDICYIQRFFVSFDVPLFKFSERQMVFISATQKMHWKSDVSFFILIMLLNGVIDWYRARYMRNEI